MSTDLKFRTSALPALAIGLVVAFVAGCAGSSSGGDGGTGVGGRTEAPAWVTGVLPDRDHVYAVGTIIYPERMSQRDASRRAFHEAIVRVARYLQDHVGELDAFFESVLTSFPESEEQARREAQQFAAHEGLEESITPSMWLTLRVHQNMMLVVENETLDMDTFHVREESAFGGETNDRDGEARRQTFVLAGVQRGRLHDVLVREAGVYGIELDRDEGPAYLLEVPAAPLGSYARANAPTSE